MKHIPLEAVSHVSLSSSCQVHRVEIPPCCCVSRNPMPGSYLYIGYLPESKSLEVAALFANIHSYREGLHDKDGQLVLRNMEDMIASVAQEAAQCLEQLVCVIALLEIVPKQQMYLDAFGTPEGMFPRKRDEDLLLARVQRAIHLLSMSKSPDDLTTTCLTR